MKIFNNVSVSVLVGSLVLATLPIIASAAGPAAVNLGSAGNFVILSKTGISTTGSTEIEGDIGLSPAAASYITGFALTLPAASAFSTSALVDGKVYAPGYANPTPATMTTAVSDMETAYTDGMGRTNPTATELGAGDIGGMTLAPGLYKWGTGVTIPTDVTLSGGGSDVWIFQIAQNLNISSATKVLLSGGAKAGNIFWVVAGQTTIGTTAVFNGNILDQTAIVLNTGATLNGRALAQTAVTLDASSVTIPSGGATTPAPTPTSNPTPTPNQTPTQTPTPTPTQTPTLTPQKQQLYNQFVSAGATPSAALNAVNQISTSPSTGSGQATPTPSASLELATTIAVDLEVGSRGSDVTILQQFLISQNTGPAAQALATVGATAYFGALTRAALAEFQAKVGINPPMGYFGPITRGYIRAHY